MTTRQKYFSLAPEPGQGPHNLWVRGWLVNISVSHVNLNSHHRLGQQRRQLSIWAQPWASREVDATRRFGRNANPSVWKRGQILEVHSDCSLENIRGFPQGFPIKYGRWSTIHSWFPYKTWWFSNYPGTHLPEGMSLMNHVIQIQHLHRYDGRVNEVSSTDLNTIEVSCKHLCINLLPFNGYDQVTRFQKSSAVGAAVHDYRHCNHIPKKTHWCFPPLKS